MRESWCPLAACRGVGCKEQSILPVPVAGDVGRGQGWQGGCCTVVTLMCAGVLWAGTACDRVCGHQGVFQHLQRSKVLAETMVTSP